MSDQHDLQTQAKNLASAKYDAGEARWKSFTRFAGSAAPAMITFGLGAAALTIIVTGGAALFGAFAATSILPTVATVGIGTAALSGTVTGIAASSRAAREMSDCNQAIDVQIERLKTTALEQGTPIPEQAVSPPEAINPAKNSPFIQGLLEKGKQTFSPVDIVKRAAQDAGVVQER